MSEELRNLVQYAPFGIPGGEEDGPTSIQDVAASTQYSGSV